MAAAMSTIAVTAATTPWVAVYSASGSVTIGLQNRSEHDMLVRVDASAATSDAVTAAADKLAPGEHRTYALVSGDDVVARMAGAANGITGALTLRTP